MPNDIRSKLLRYNPFRSELVQVALPQPPADDGAPVADEVITVLVKQPTVAERNQILAKMKSGANGVETSSALESYATAVALCVKHPDTGEPIFAADVLDTLRELPAGGWVDLLAGKVFSLMNASTESTKK